MTASKHQADLHASYAAWRITYQSSEQAARAAYARVQELEAQLESIGAGGVEPLRRRECLHQIEEPAPAHQEAHQTAPVNAWQQAIDHELVTAHLGVAGAATIEEARKTLHELICWHIDVATDPATNGGKVLVDAARAPADSVTAPAYSIDADPQGIRARVADAITGALAFGAQGANPPPTGHWLVPFWETAREEASRNRPVSSDTLYLLRRLLSNQHTLTSAEFREELTKIVGEAYQQEAQKPYAYAVYFPDQPTVELVHDLDELTDDLTNREHQITKLYTAPQAAPAAQGDAPTDAGPISRQWLTVVYRGVEAGDEVQQICTHPKVSAMSWSHAIHDRDAARSQQGGK